MHEQGGNTTTGRIPGLALALATIAVAALALTSLVSYTLYHTIAEVVFVVLGVAVFLMSWLLREFTDDDFPVFLGIVLFATAILHLVHAVDFPGVGIVTSSLDAPTQLWVATVLLTAVSFVAAPFVLGRRLPVQTVLIAYLLVDVLILMAVYWWGILPSMLTAEGLTPAKIAAEYVACGLFALSIFLLWQRRRLLPPTAFPLLVAAISANIAAEIAFTAYTGPHTWPNMLGHMLLDVSTVLIYTAAVQASIAWPHAMKVANLMLSERAARAERRQEHAIRKALDRLLDLNLSFQADKGTTAMAQTACASACEIFHCDHAMLMDVEGESLVLAAIYPPHRDVAVGIRFSIADDPDLFERLRARIPSFKAETSERTLGPSIAHLASLLEQNSVLRAPIGVGPVADRLLVLGWVRHHEEPDALMRALLQRFGDQVGAALAQARRREVQAETEALHRRFERSLLPTLPTAHPKLEVYSYYRPGEHRLELGGDFIDVYDRGEAGLAVIVGDVSGHGPDAAAIGAMLRAGWRALEAVGAEPAEVVHSLHEVLLRERADESTFATLCLAWIDPLQNEMTLLNIGHPPPLLIDDGDVTRVDVAPVPPLGTFALAATDPVAVELPGSAQLFFYTDGLIEGRAVPGSRERYGERRLIAALRNIAQHGVDDRRLEQLLSDIEETSGGPFEDDVTIVVVSSRQSPTAAASAFEADQARDADLLEEDTRKPAPAAGRARASRSVRRGRPGA